MHRDPVPLQPGTPSGMLPHTALSRFKCIAFGFAERGALERLPASLSPQQRGAGHSRSYPGRPSPRGRQSGCLGTLFRGQPACLHSPSPHKLPPGEFPGLSAPMWKARSQSRLRPRKLRVIRLSLRSCCLAAACRLRRSCRRDRGPVTLPRSGCPVRRSRHPAAFPGPPATPPPAAPRGILRSCSTARP